MLAQEETLELIEWNCEDKTLNTLSKNGFPISDLIDEIELETKKKLHDKTLLFFDEVQEAPKLLNFLRYFHEKKTNIKVIASGSLLEWALRTGDFSFPVGRVEFYYLYPMTFKEFLWATDQSMLEKKLEKLNFSDVVHEASIKALQKYYYVGGMPEAIKVFSETESLLDARKKQTQIIQTYKADFPKYNKRIDVKKISSNF